jgi:hypothetical protein
MMPSEKRDTSPSDHFGWDKAGYPPRHSVPTVEERSCALYFNDRRRRVCKLHFIGESMHFFTLDGAAPNSHSELTMNRELPQSLLEIQGLYN